jgi:hypothetical protein
MGKQLTDCGGLRVSPRTPVQMVVRIIRPGVLITLHNSTCGSSQIVLRLRNIRQMVTMRC